MNQRYSAHWTLGRYHNRLSVTDMLNYLGWRSLDMRLGDAHMSTLYKMSNGLVAINTPSYLVHPVGIAASAHPHHFIVPQTFNQLQLNFFFPGFIWQWNALPDTVALAPLWNPSNSRCVKSTTLPKTNQANLLTNNLLANLCFPSCSFLCRFLSSCSCFTNKLTNITNNHCAPGRNCQRLDWAPLSIDRHKNIFAFFIISIY